MVWGSKFLTVVVSTSALIVALSTAYYLIVFIPRREIARQELEKSKLELERQRQETAVLGQQREGEEFGDG